MTATAAQLPASTGRRPFRRLRDFWSGITAVSVKELRGRMRGRRAFTVVAVYLVLLAGFAFGVDTYLRRQDALATRFMGTFDSSDLTLSASIGHAMFTGLLLLLTLLVLVLAPAFTSGAISMEREKQTLDLLSTTPLSTLGMVIGKLFSALTYVFLLIVASIPVMALVFVYGGVGPEDVIRAYALLFALAFGMGAVGLFISALVRRTQTATVLTFLVVISMTLGSVALHQFWTVLGTQSTNEGAVVVQRPNRAPEALLWLNPFVGDLDLICTTAPGGYQRYTCDYVAAVTGTPFFATGGGEGIPFACPPNARCMIDDAVPQPGFGVGGRELGPAIGVVVAADGLVKGFAPADPVADDVAQQQGVPTFGFPRDTFWPRSALAFVLVGIVLTLLSAQLVTPTRRFRLRRRRRSTMTPVPATGPQTTDEVTP